MGLGEAGEVEQGPGELAAVGGQGGAGASDRVTQQGEEAVAGGGELGLGGGRVGGEKEDARGVADLGQLEAVDRAGEVGEEAFEQGAGLVVVASGVAGSGVGEEAAAVEEGVGEEERGVGGEVGVGGEGPEEEDGPVVGGCGVVGPAALAEGVAEAD